MSEYLRVFLIRHGQTGWNCDGNRYCGSSDVELDEVGKQQARALARRLAEERIDAVYSSPLIRAFDTAAMIAEPHRLQVEKIPGLAEWSFGDWEGLTEQEIADRYPDLFQLWQARPDQALLPNGERAHEVLSRSVKAFYEILARHRTREQICIVSHNMINRILLTEIAQADLSHCRIWLQKNTCVNRILWNGSHFRIETVNDISHLEFSY